MLVGGDERRVSTEGKDSAVEARLSAGAGETLDLGRGAVMPAANVLAALGSSSQGLTRTEAADRLGRFGPNVIHSHRVTAFGIFLRQVRNPLLILLLAAAIVSGGTGDPTDAIIITTIVALSVGLGFANEYRSEQAVAALHAAIHHETVVTRDGSETRVDVRELVPGDVIALHIGDVVPADVRLLETTQLECDEGVLTGESMPAPKSAEPASKTDSTIDLSSCAFMGTIVHQGAARAVVVSTAARTDFGRIAVGLGSPQAYTAFQAGLKDFSKMLVGVAGALTVSIFIINLALGRPWLDAVLFSLAIAIGITPQLLPAIVSVSLATGSRQLARRKVLIKRLVTIEDLGNIQVLFTDKTGTLTAGAIAFDGSLDPAGCASPRPLLLGLICNEATPTENGAVSGNPLDQALWNAPGVKALQEGTDGLSSYKRLGMLPFDHDRQLVSVTASRADGSTILITKGAPEAVLARCSNPSTVAGETLQHLFSDGARVVAIATREASGLSQPRPEDEANLHLEGFLTFADPPKAAAKTFLTQRSRAAP